MNDRDQYITVREFYVGQKEILDRIDKMDKRINGRIRNLEDEKLLRVTFVNASKLVIPGVLVGVLTAVLTLAVGA